MEIAQRHIVSAGDLSDSESMIEAEPEEEVVAKDATNERLIRAIARMCAREKMDIPVYEGNLDAEELLD
jgi:rubrerythrin